MVWPQWNEPQKKYRLWTVSKNKLLEGLNQFHGANLNLTLSSDGNQDTEMLVECPLSQREVVGSNPGRTIKYDQVTDVGRVRQSTAIHCQFRLVNSKLSIIA